MFGREGEGDAVRRIAQECLATGQGVQNTGFALLTEILGEGAVPGDQADNTLGTVNVEVVGDDLPARRGWRRGQHAVEKSGKVGFGPAVADGAADLAGGHVE